MRVKGTYVTRNVKQNCRILDFIHMRGTWRKPIDGLQRGLPDIPRDAAGEYTSELLVDPRHPDEVSGSQEGEYLRATNVNSEVTFVGEKRGEGGLPRTGHPKASL